MFNFFKSKSKEPETPAIADNAVVSPADGQLVDIASVSDPVFAQEMMGKSAALKLPQSKVTLCAPANGKLTVLYPTGHAFGIAMNNGNELLVHIGIDTVNANGDGFKTLKKKQGDIVKAGDPIVEVDVNKLQKTYDMTTMIILVNGEAGCNDFVKQGNVSRLQSICA